MNFALANPARQVFFTVLGREEKYNADRVLDERFGRSTKTGRSTKKMTDALAEYLKWRVDHAKKTAAISTLRNKRTMLNQIFRFA